MKTLITKILAFSGLALLMLSSCKKDETKAVATSGTAPMLTASATNLILTKALSTNAAINFSWSSANYGYSAAVTNVLQIDVKGNNFAKPKEITPAANTNLQVYNVVDFNAVALSLGLTPGVNSGLEARVKSTIGGNSAPIYSNVVSVTVNPFTLISYIYAPGSYQNTSVPLQWTPATADSLVSTTGNGIYTGYMYFNSGAAFKITPVKTWANSYGDAGGGKIAYNSGGNISAPGVGLYQVTVDLNANTIVFASADHTWSVIGDAAAGWSTDIPMTFNLNANVYQTTTALGTSGAFKFRADNAWALALGDVTPVTGQLSSTGGNIAAPTVAGNYLITLNYGNPLLGPTYKLVKQ